ncbi:MAG TPA: DoxX family protein [Terriglobales bacterium]
MTLTRPQQPALTLFAIGMIGLGILALIYGDFALVWQPVAPWVPGRTALAYASGVIMLFGGIGLLFRATAAWSVRILFPYLIIWILLKVPAVVVAPRIEAVWLGIAELAVLLTGGWILFAKLANLQEGSPLGFLATENSIRVARILFAVSLIPIGLSHIIYVKETAALVPAWLPHRIGWAYLTGAGHIAAGLGILLSILPKAAARAEAGMLTIFTLLVWVPAIVAAPKTRLPWTAFFISWAIASAAWVVAQNISPKHSTAADPLAKP